MSKMMAAILPPTYPGNNNDLLPENESSVMLDWKLGSESIDGQQILHAGSDYEQPA